MPRFWAIIPAAGVGRRMAAASPKQYLALAGRTVIEQSLTALLRSPQIDGVVVGLAPADPYWTRLGLKTAQSLRLSEGGAERCHTVFNALRALESELTADDWVLVHDAVRPCLRAADLDRLMHDLKYDPVGGLLAAPVRDTLKRSDESLRITATVDRDTLWHAQTPQMFRYGVLYAALSQVLAQGRIVTDEAQAVEAYGLQPRIVPGSHDNIKITGPEDLTLAEFYLTRKHD